MIKIENLTHRYGRRSTDGIQNINLEFHSNTINSIIGPSGAGKTTLLKCISSQITEFEGKISFQDQVTIGFLENKPIEDLEQSLFDFLFSAIDSTQSDEQKISQIRTLLSQLELTNEIDSKLNNLSSGQKQRALIAKSLINNPTVLLLDEPFANLDNNLRDLFLKDLFELLKSKEITIIWVTHNTDEALKFSDKIAVMQFGQLEQFASPADIYSKPHNIFVAQFFGENNILGSKILQKTEDQFLIKVMDQEISIPAHPSITYDDLLVMLRPESFFITKNGTFKGEITDIYFEGPISTLVVKNQQRFLNIRVLGVCEHKVGDKIKFSFDSTKIHPLFT